MIATAELFRPECENCVYWETTSGFDNTGYMFCSYGLKTGINRSLHEEFDENGQCIHKDEPKPKRRKDPFMVPFGQRGL